MIDHTQHLKELKTCPAYQEHICDASEDQNITYLSIFISVNVFSNIKKWHLRAKPIKHKQAYHATQIRQLIQSGKVVRDEH